MTLIKCNDLSLGYNGRCIAEGISFEVNGGDYLCIVGENGTGKSTLIKTLLGILPRLDGNVEYGDGLKKSEIGYLPQQSAAQKDFPASAMEVVMSGLCGSSGLLPFYTKSERQKARDSMELLGITDIAKNSYATLSGGQKQRVLLARALCASSRLIVLDEPVTALDPKVTEDMYSVISKLNSTGVAVIMVSHDVDEAVKHSTHILHLDRRPKFFGLTENYIKSDVGKAFLKGGDRQ